MPWVVLVGLGVVATVRRELQRLVRVCGRARGLLVVVAVVGVVDADMHVGVGWIRWRGATGRVRIDAMASFCILCYSLPS